MSVGKEAFKVPDGAPVVFDDKEDEVAEKAHEEDTERIRKILEGELEKGEPEKGEPEKGEETKTPGAEERKPSADEVADAPGELSQVMKDRAKAVGLDDALTERLHQAGLLEESMAFHHQKLTDAIEFDPDKPVTPVAPVKDEQKQQKEERKPDPVVEGELDPLDPDLHGEDLSKREVLLRKQITELRAEVDSIKVLSASFQGDRQEQLDQWFNDQVDSLKQPDLFGDNGLLPVDSPERANRKKLFTRYVKSCMASGKDHLGRDQDSFEIAFPAEFRNEIFKAGQKQVLDFARDKAGKFMSPASASSGSAPAPQKQVSEEEAYQEDLGKVKQILAAGS